jgi:hypothetical protein
MLCAGAFEISRRTLPHPDSTHHEHGGQITQEQGKDPVR